MTTRRCCCSSAGSSHSEAGRLLRAAARLLEGCGPGCATGWSWRWWAGPPAPALHHPRALEALAAELGVADVVRFVEPQAQDALPDWYRAADVTVVPSYSESSAWWPSNRPAGRRSSPPRSAACARRSPTAGWSPRPRLHDPDDYAALLAGLSDQAAPPGGARPRRRRPRGAVRLGCDGGPCWTSTRTCSPSARCRRPSRGPAGDGPPAVTEEQARALEVLLGSLRDAEARTRAAGAGHGRGQPPRRAQGSGEPSASSSARTASP